MHEIEHEILGDIGGAWIPRDQGLDLEGDPAALPPVLYEMMQRWLGMSAADYANIAWEVHKGKRKGPGVILLAIGCSKRDIVRHVVERGMINVLIVDEDLGVALCHTS